MADVITQELTEIVEVVAPDVTNLVTEDDAPVDNLFSEKQQRLLVESLYASWQGTFLAAANVAIYYQVHHSPLVPDVLLSTETQVPEDWYAKEKRSYFVWEFGKLPDLVIEIVSNKQGGEAGNKLNTYARMGVDYYIILDPTHQLGDETLRAYERRGHTYQHMDDAWFENIQLGAQLWQGTYENKEALWLRWRDKAGNILLTGSERAERERERAERFAAKLRALGIEPE